MPVFRNTSQIQNFMEQKAHQALEEIAKEVYQDWYDMIYERLYVEDWLKTGNKDSGYQRSMDLLNSLEIMWKTPLKCEIGYNGSKINAVRTDNGFNQHMSMSGADWSKAIPYFIEFGNNPNGKNPIVEYDGIGAFDAIVNILKYSFDKQLKEALQKRGMTLA